MLQLLLILQLQAPAVTKNFLPGKIPRDTTRNYIVLHNDGGNLNASSTRLVLRTRRLAYHYFIQRDGSIHQFMDLRYIAKHAGITSWNGISGWNNFSIGIALQGVNFMEYTCNQYKSLKKLLDYINLRYPDSNNYPILTHAEIAWPRGRKHDPGPNFDLRRLNHDVSCDP